MKTNSNGSVGTANEFFICLSAGTEVLTQDATSKNHGRVVVRYIGGSSPSVCESTSFILFGSFYMDNS